MAEEATLTVRVVPRSRRDEIAGWQEGALRVRLTAPPVDGRANEALRQLLAQRLGVPLRDVVIVSGETARIKRVRLEGLTIEAVMLRLGVQDA